MNLKIGRKRGILLLLSAAGVLALLSCSGGGASTDPEQSIKRVVSDVTVFQAGTVNAAGTSVSLTVSWSNPANTEDVAGYAVEYKTKDGDWTLLNDADKDGLSVTGKTANYIKGAVASGQFKVGDTISVRVRAISSSADKAELFSGPSDADAETDPTDVNGDGTNVRMSDVTLGTKAATAPVLGVRALFDDYKSVRFAVADRGTRTLLQYDINAYKLTDGQAARIQTDGDFLRAKTEFPISKAKKIVSGAPAEADPKVGGMTLSLTEDRLKAVLVSDSKPDYGTYVFEIVYNGGPAPYHVKAFVYKFQESAPMAYTASQTPLSRISLPKKVAAPDTPPTEYKVNIKWEEPGERGENFLGVKNTSLSYVLTRVNASNPGTEVYKGDKTEAADSINAADYAPPFTYNLTVKSNFGDLTSTADSRLSQVGTFATKPESPKSVRFQEGVTAFTHALNSESKLVLFYNLAWDMPADKGKKEDGTTDAVLKALLKDAFDVRYRFSGKDENGKDYPYIIYPFKESVPELKTKTVDGKDVSYAVLKLFSVWDPEKEGKDKKNFDFRVRYKNSEDVWSDYAELKGVTPEFTALQGPDTAVNDAIEYDGDLRDGIVSYKDYFTQEIAARKTSVTLKWTIKDYKGKNYGKNYDGTASSPKEFRLGYKLADADDSEFKKNEMVVPGVIDGSNYKGQLKLEIPFEGASGKILSYKFRVQVVNESKIASVGKISDTLTPTLYLEGGPLVYDMNFGSELWAGRVDAKIGDVLNEGGWPKYTVVDGKDVRTRATPDASTPPKYTYAGGQSQYVIYSGSLNQAKLQNAKAGETGGRRLFNSEATVVHTVAADRDNRKSVIQTPRAVGDFTVIAVAEYRGKSDTYSQLFDRRVGRAGTSTPLETGTSPGFSVYKKLNPQNLVNNFPADLTRIPRGEKAGLDVMAISLAKGQTDSYQFLLDDVVTERRLFNGYLMRFMIYKDPDNVILERYGKEITSYLMKKHGITGIVPPAAVDSASASISGTNLRVTLDPVPIGKPDTAVEKTAGYDTKYGTDAAATRAKYYGKTRGNSDAEFRRYLVYLKSKTADKNDPLIYVGQTSTQFDPKPTDSSKKETKRVLDFPLNTVRSFGASAGDYYVHVRMEVRPNGSTNLNNIVWSELPADSIEVTIPAP